MSMPFHVPPEQVIAERAELSRQGIARGRSLVALSCDEGILIVAENHSTLLRKVSEVYDRIAYAGAGRYNEFDQLRKMCVREADLTGYQYSRDDVEARRLANSLAQIVGAEFTAGAKPLEVEILVAEVGVQPADDCLLRISFDGTVSDEEHHCAIGGDSTAVGERLTAALPPDGSLRAALVAASAALSGPDRSIATNDLEAALLARTGRRRRFTRIATRDIEEMLG